MNVPKSILIALLLGFVIFGGCVVVSLVTLNQCREDRAFMFQHCTLSR